MPDEGIIYLDTNAVISFFLRRAGRLIPLFIMVVILLLIPTCHSGVTVNGHPATEADYQFMNKIKWMGVAVLGLLLIIQWFYCVFLARSYRIEMHKDGVLLKYGVFNLNNELLLFAKIQDIVINRNILERMLGISTIVIQNAMGKAEIIPGLKAATAETLRESILGHTPR